MNIDEANSIGRRIASATGSRLDKDTQEESDGFSLGFYTEGLKIGGYDDIDSNDGEVMLELEKKTKQFMSSNYPNIKFSIDDSEKGYWYVFLKKEEIKPIQKSIPTRRKDGVVQRYKKNIETNKCKCGGTFRDKIDGDECDSCGVLR